MTVLGTALSAGVGRPDLALYAAQMGARIRYAVMVLLVVLWCAFAS
jgi:hypothetical protein